MNHYDLFIKSNQNTISSVLQVNIAIFFSHLVWKNFSIIKKTFKLPYWKISNKTIINDVRRSARKNAANVWRRKRRRSRRSREREEARRGTKSPAGSRTLPVDVTSSRETRRHAPTASLTPCPRFPPAAQQDERDPRLRPRCAQRLA